MNINEKNQHVLEHLRNKILLSQNNAFHIILKDLVADGLTIAEIVTILNRLQNEKVIKVTSAGVAENAKPESIFKIYEIFTHTKHDLSILTRNELDQNYALGIAVNPIFLDLISESANNDEELKLLANILLNEVPLTFPLDIHCPKDRSKISHIKDKKEWKKIQLFFSKGETKKCTDRRHSCTFRFQNGEMIIKVIWNKGENGAKEIDDKNPKE